ncbi:hypothetical protein K7432_010624 [Basidiobolus ranarum]|uniref:Major facilitator superfamily (MFS) profile domain-containing protein n=1 Tax=Basidiobolus ranarum TaxID=34480 RepID=A0ABR2WNJ0_9FUNG
MSLDEKTERMGDIEPSYIPVQAQEGSAPVKYLFKVVPVNPNVGYLNVLALILGVFATIALLVFQSIIQSSIIITNLGVSVTEQGNVVGSLTMYQEIIVIFMCIFWGPISDLTGKRYVYAISFFCLGTALIAYPHARNVYPDLLLIRLLFGMGSSGATTMMTATLGDIIVKSGGFISGFIGATSGCGALLGVFVLSSVPALLANSTPDYFTAVNKGFHIIGGSAIALGVILWFMLPSHTDVWEGPDRWLWRKLNNKFSSGVKQEKKSLKVNRPKRENYFLLLKKGFMAAKDPRVALGYATSFVARSDEVMLTTFVTMWVSKVFYLSGRCKSPDKLFCPVGQGQSELMTGTGQIVALLVAPFYGWAHHYFRRSTVTFVGGVFGVIGCFGLAFNHDPYNKINYFWITLIGCGEIGMIISSMSLVNGPYVPPGRRGSIAGAYSFCGSISILVITKLGGYLFDTWMAGAPFFILGVCHCCVTVASFILRFIEPRLPDTWVNPEEKHELETHTVQLE